MTTTTSYRINDNLFLVRHRFDVTAAANNEILLPVHHILCIDCSGSMWEDLPKVRQQLKDKLPKLLRENDTVSIIWFSGKGQCSALLTHERVAGLADLSRINEMIDRWLKPVGMTGFVDPINMVHNLVADSGLHSLFFMTDGCENQEGRTKVFGALGALANSGFLSSATFVEYGYYADRKLLADMAARVGGTLIFAESFDQYAPALEKSLTRMPSTGGKTWRDLEGKAIARAAFALNDGALLSFFQEESHFSIEIDADLSEAWSLQTSAHGQYDLRRALIEGIDFSLIAAAYAAVSVFATLEKPEIVLAILQALGDKALVEQFGGCYGKQQYTIFQEAAKRAAFDPKERWKKGVDYNCIPKDDAFCVMDLLRILSEDEGNRALLDHPGFRYNRIGRARKLADPNAPAFFVRSDGLLDQGYPVDTLVFNEDRANVSIRIEREGVVDISNQIPPNLRNRLPGQIPSRQYRTYTVVKDGMLNIESLPVLMTEDTWDRLFRAGFTGLTSIEQPNGKHLTTLPLTGMPIINRKLVGEAVTSQAFFETHIQLVEARAAQAVYNGYLKKYAPAAKQDQSFETVYGEEAVKWLKSIGLTPAGYRPPEKSEKGSDEYLSKVLKVSIKGLSDLPSFTEAFDQWQKNQLPKNAPDHRKKLTAGAELMAPHIKRVEDFLAGDFYAGAADKAGVLTAFLKGEAADSTARVRRLLRRAAEHTFRVIVGQAWFADYREGDWMTIEWHGGKKYQCKVERKEVPVKL